jgi:hypothetical protein
MKWNNSRVHFVQILFYSLLSLLLIRIHHFANPVPTKIYYSIIIFEFLISFVAYSISLKWGRISIVLGVLLFNRLASFAYTDIDLIITGGFFWGGTTGLLFRIFLDFSNYSPFISSIHERFVFSRSFEKIKFNLAYPGVIFFLFVLITNSFLEIYPFPYLNGMDFQESFYLPDLPSRAAFSIPVNIISNLAFVLIYFYVEEKTYRDYYRAAFRDFSQGLMIALVIHAIVIFIQSFISLDFFNNGTNLSAEKNRVTGLFRDAGSATWIFPLMVSYSIYYIIKEYNITKYKYIFILIIGFFILGSMIGFKQGRAYLIILTVSMLLLFLRSLKMYWNRVNSKKVILLGISSSFVVLIAFFLFLQYTAGGKLLNTFEEFYRSDTFIEKIKNSDPNRYFLNQVALWNFEKKPIFGGGVGVVTLSLKNPDLPIVHTVPMVDGPGSFYTGILSDIGIIGTIVVLLWLSVQLYYRKNLFNLFFLVIPLLFGYHITHADGAFFILLFLAPLNRIRRNLSSYSIKVNYAIFIFSVLFLIYGVISKVFQDNGNSFRYENLGKYQLFNFTANNAVSSNNFYPEKENVPISYYTFKGSIYQRSTIVGKVNSCAFLGRETKLMKLILKYSYFDKDKKILSYETISLEKFKLNAFLNIPENTSYIKIEELDENGNWKMIRGTIFSIVSDCYNSTNEFTGNSIYN